MAAIQSSSFPAISSIRCSRYSLHYSSLSTSSSVCFAPPSTAAAAAKGRRKACRAMVQQAVQGAPATYAKEMERLSAKESLLLALKDAGGFEALVTGKTTDMQRIDVNERIISLERLNPTPRPTTSPFLEGRWNFEWFESGSPGLFAARFIFPRLPSDLANLSKLDVVIKDGIAKVTANLKLFYSVHFYP
uniref:Plastid lipid-associated protein/fibrillin conserved domain-containing protein n=1 Tax=Rhizophora mucronata TaxID=61149 RepID=A0A2P2JDI2_RHIMU